MKKRTKRLCAILLMIVMVLGMMPASVFGEVATESCIAVKADAPATAAISAGELYELKFADVFEDAENHSLSYSFAATVENEHTKIKENVFYFSAAAGTYDVTLTAKCEKAELSHKLTITVKEGNAGIAAQYGYDETNKNSVTVNVTLSNDGYPIMAEDGTVLSHLEVKVPYFDLALYGMEDFYRYGTKNGQGIYVNDKLIQRPTGLHLYIYLLERYYMGLPEEKCCLGTSGVLEYAKDTEVNYMDGTSAYESKGKHALATSGGPTSIYMTNFWGHDENLMYFRNHCYPYMSPGWGATSDYILLSDGDTWDVAMFSNWEFHNYGYFARFDQNDYTAEVGKNITVQTQKWGTSAAATSFEAVNGLTIGLYNSKWELVKEMKYDSETGNSITFTAPETAGIYYLMGLDPSAQDAEDACIAPATAVLTVTGGSTDCEECTDEDGNRICDVCSKNLNKLPTLIEGVEPTRTVKIQTGLSYQLTDLTDGKIFTDEDDTLTYESYFYRKSSDGGKTWGELTGFSEMEHGGVNNSLANSAAGTYLYEFVAYDGFGYSEDTWTLKLETLDVVPANVSFYLGQDQNYKTNGSVMPVLELYKTAGIDEDLYDYVGWFTNAEGATEYVYNPADYEIVDGERDYVVIEGKQYELYDYEKITFTNSAFDDTDTTATASGTVVDGYNMFYATVTTGRYSTRAYGYNTETSAYDIYLGGQSMELPREVDIYGNGGDNIYLRVVSIYTTSKKTDSTYFTADDYHAEMIMPVTGGMIHSGDPYVRGNYTYFPFMSWAAGNGSLYNTYVYPKDTDSYIFTQTINNTTSAGTSAVSKSMVINAAIPLKVTVPAEGDFGLYMQYNNFNTKKAEPIGEATLNGDGTKTITYKISKSNGNYTWRLSDPSGTYVTKTGWLKNANQASEQTFTFSEFTNKASHDFSNLGTAVKTRDEADLQVFLSASGFKSVSDKTRIRAYRMWQIINSDPGNIMIEPDFNIQVLQGNASDIELVSGGNALNNWIDVTPTTTDIVAVNYDALEVIHTTDTYSTHGGLFPATNPERTNVFIITNETAGTAAAHIPFNGSKDTDRGTEWDYNYDTWFYLNNAVDPTLDFTVTGTGDTTVQYATVITGSDLKSKLSDWMTLSADKEGSYHASLIPFAETKGGTVIIKMTDSTGISYALVRVAKMSATATNASNPGEPFMPGDNATITFDGLYRSINKISGIFNPTTYYLRYTVDDTEVNGALGQYQQMDKASITLTIPEDITFPEGETTVDYAFTNGYVYGNMYAASSPFQSMYYITDTGVGTNFSAVGVSFVLSRLADIPITVQQKVCYDMKLNVTDGENTLSDYIFTLSDPDGNPLTPDENGIYQDLSYGEYTYTLSKTGYIGQNGTLKLGSADAENVADGILTKTIVAVKAAEGAWDGTSVEEPKKDENGVYQIGTGAELAWFAQTVNAGTTSISAVLTKDIDLACYNWTPIGNSTNKLAGSIDGQGHKVYNMTIINTAATTGVGYGFIGYMNGGSVQNLTVEGTIDLTNSASVSNGYAGGVIGACSGSVTLNNVHADVDITITRVKGNWTRVGGLVGNGGSITITNCSNSGDINGYQYVGGIVGYLTNGTVIGCFNDGEISGYQYVGGIAASGAPGTITNCYNIGGVSATSNYVGGIISNATSTSALSNCFNAGTITFGGTSAYAGAVVGYSNNAKGINANLYYLEGSYSCGIGTNKNTVDAAVVSAETLASAAFVAAMNKDLETAAYKKGPTHPIFVWQVITPKLTMSADKTSVTEGESITVTVSIDQAVGNLTAYQFNLYYDDAMFAKESASIGAASAKTVVGEKSTDDKGTYLPISGLDTTGQAVTLNGGEIASVTFKANSAIKADAVFELTVDAMSDYDTFENIAVIAPEKIAVSVTGCTHEAKEVIDAAVEATFDTTGLTEGKHCSGCGEILIPQETIPMLKVSAPKNLKASSAGYNSVKISWDEVSGASGYAVYRSTSKSGVYSFVARTTNTSLTNVSLTTGKTYYYKVRAYRTVNGERVYGSYAEIVSAKPTLAKPASIAAASAGATSVKISWDKVTGASGYAVYRSTSKNGTYSFVARTTKLALTNIGRTTGMTYYYKVRAYTTVGGTRIYGNYSSVVSAKPVPAKVTNVKAVSAGYNSIKVSWNKVTGASGYAVYRSTSKNGTYSLVTRTTNHSITNGSRTTGKTYYYKVKAYKLVDGKRVYGEISSYASAKPVPAAPVITAKNAGSKKIALSWKKINGASGYAVYRSTAKDGTYSLVGRTTKLAYTDTGRTKGKTYYYKVRAYRTVDGTRIYGSNSTVKYAKG